MICILHIQKPLQDTALCAILKEVCQTWIPTQVNTVQHTYCHCDQDAVL